MNDRGTGDADEVDGARPEGLGWPDDPLDPEGYPSEGPGSLPSIGQRGLARASDFVLSVMLPGGLMIYLTQQFAAEVSGDEVEITNPALAWSLFVLIPVIPFVYETAMVAWRGQTVGKLLGRLQVLSLDDGLVPTPRAALIRAALPGGLLLLTVLPVLSLFGQLGYLAVYLSSLLDQALRRGWHDKLAGTVVVRSG